MAKQAQIKVRQFEENGKPYVEILGFKNVLTVEELPKEYLRMPEEYLRNGKLKFILYHLSKTDLLECYYPSKEGNLLNLFRLYPGRILSKPEFDEYMFWLERAGARLAKINKKQKLKAQPEPTGCRGDPILQRDFKKTEPAFLVCSHHGKGQALAKSGLLGFLQGIEFTEEEAEKVHDLIRQRTRKTPPHLHPPSQCFNCGKIVDFRAWQDTRRRVFCSKECADLFNKENLRKMPGSR